MPTRIAFLRAINVGGRRVVKMDALKRAFTQAGCENAKTYIQSGNVSFDAPVAGWAGVERRIRAGLQKILGSEPLVVYRTLRELQKIASSDPFKQSPPDPDCKRYVAFLSGKPPRRPTPPLLSPKDGLEVFRIDSLEAFVLSRKVKDRYGFPNGFIEKEFGVRATTRNWNTVEGIVETLDLLSAPNFKKRLRRSVSQMKEGQTLSLEEALGDEVERARRISAATTNTFQRQAGAYKKPAKGSK